MIKADRANVFNDMLLRLKHCATANKENMQADRTTEAGNPTIKEKLHKAPSKHNILIQWVNFPTCRNDNRNTPIPYKIPRCRPDRAST